jgi:hypothetical protein
MIWLTWAQHRREAMVTAVLLGIAAALLVITGLSMIADFQQSGVAKCLGPASPAVGLFVGGSPCDAAQAFPLRWHRVTLGAFLALITLPALLGVFIAAPLFSREIEYGTHLLAWSQSITRLRWAAIKVGLVTLGVIVAAAALATLVTWWRGAMDLADFNGQWAAFDIEGLVPVGYATFALALGTLAGLVIGRTVPAMAATLFAFVAVRVAVAQIRPHFIQPLTGPAIGIGRGTWITSSSAYYVDAQGHQLTLDQVNAVGRAFSGSSGSGYMDYLLQHGIRFLADYQPAERFWTFQLIEAAVFVGLASALIAATLWWLQRRA